VAEEQSKSEIDIKEASSVIDRGLSFLFGKSKITTILGGIIAVCAYLVFFPETFKLIGLSEQEIANIIGYFKFLGIVLFIFLGRLVGSEYLFNKLNKGK
jgi:hypothetical protein